MKKFMALSVLGAFAAVSFAFGAPAPKATKGVKTTKPVTQTTTKAMSTSPKAKAAKTTAAPKKATTATTKAKGN